MLFVYYNVSAQKCISEFHPRSTCYYIGRSPAGRVFIILVCLPESFSTYSFIAMYYEILSMCEAYHFSQKGTIIFDHEPKHIPCAWML